jgi:hypothetical protein
MKKYLLLSSFLLAACSVIPTKDIPNKLFSYGVYHHNISVTGKDKQLSFTGINQWSKERFVVIGLGPFDMTVIKYEENKETLNQELYINKEIIALDDDKVLKMMSLMKAMYYLDHSICDGKYCATSFWGVPIKLELNDQNQVINIKIERGDIKVNVDVTAFEKIL